MTGKRKTKLNRLYPFPHIQILKLLVLEYTKMNLKFQADLRPRQHLAKILNDVIKDIDSYVHVIPLV